ncbi:RNA methyltransferase, TrmH family [Williamsia serinedens]|uniref:RNA methyltransferase, TrmH family n=1 Tax=Williamsia serinedens TaxID=391736 RepID=A0ABT1H592_9NOCA|nr:RNA methyltransferase, TrmH family [Williamsia serinedens]
MVETALTERSTRVVSLSKLHRAAQRRDRGVFLVEGANAVGSALAVGAVRTVLVREDDVTSFVTILDDARAAGIEIVVITPRAADKLGETTTTPGLFAECTALDTDVDAVVAAGRDGAVVVAVDLADPGNAGTLIRTADATGCAGVVLAGDAVDVHNGKCVRASAGSVFHLPIVRDRDVAGVLTRLREAGHTVLATAAGGELSLDDLDAAGNEGLLAGPVAWVFGNEAHGLSPEVAASADHRVAIPVRGRAESLNIAAAAAMCLYVSARVHAAHTS